MYMLKLTILLALLTAPVLLSAQEAAEPVKNSLSYFPAIVIVGQVVEVNPKMIAIQNTREKTTLTTERLDRLRTRLKESKDDADSAFFKTLRTVTVTPDEHMRMNLYFDNVAHLFQDDANTYQQFLPLFYMFKSNIKEFQHLPKDMLERLNSFKADYYLTIPFIKKLMKNAWFAAVFRIHPETQKLIYQHSRFYENYEELEADPYAKEYLIADIVDRGMTTTINVSLVKGNEEKWAKEDVHKKYDDPAKKGSGNRKTGVKSGSMTGGR